MYLLLSVRASSALLLIGATLGPSRSDGTPQPSTRVRDMPAV